MIPSAGSARPQLKRGLMSSAVILRTVSSMGLSCRFRPSPARGAGADCSARAVWAGGAAADARQVAAVLGGLHNAALRGEGAMRGNPAEGSAAALDAIPREYNFASDLFDRFRSKGWLNRVAYIDRRGSWTYGQLHTRAE